MNIFENDDCLKHLSKIDTDSIDLIITDPPYGINYSNNRRNKNGKIKTENGILNDHKNNNDFLEKVLSELYRVLKDGRHIYWFGRYDSIIKQKEIFDKIGFKVKNQLIWVKNNHGTGDLYYSYASKYECILYAVKQKTKKSKILPLKKIGNTTRHSDVLFYNKVNSNIMVHDHQKPTEMLEFLIEKSSFENETILDCFVGSGATCFSANNKNRFFIGFEEDTSIFNNTKEKLMEDRFKIFSEKEEFVGSHFAKLFNQKYEKNNIRQVTKIDGKINNTCIELQELKFQKAIDNKKLIIDVLSVFYFKDKKRKTINLNDFDIKITKKGKIFSLNDEDIYLIYIDKKNIQEKDLNFWSKRLQDEQYIYLPINVKLLKKEIDVTNLVVNDKTKTKDTWESAFCYIDIINLPLYDFDALKDIFDETSSEDYENDRSLVFE